MFILCMHLSDAYLMFVFLSNVDSLFMTMFVINVFNVCYIGMYVFVVCYFYVF